MESRMPEKRAPDECEHINRNHLRKFKITYLKASGNTKMIILQREISEYTRQSQQHNYI